MRESEHLLLTEQPRNKISTKKWIGILATVVLVGCALMAANKYEVFNTDSSELAVGVFKNDPETGAKTCTQHCKAVTEMGEKEYVIQKGVGALECKTRSIPKTRNMGCTIENCCKEAGVEEVQRVRAPLVQATVQRTLPNQDLAELDVTCDAEANFPNPEDYTTLGDQWRTTKVTKTISERPMTDIPPDAVCYKNAITAKIEGYEDSGDEGFYTVVLTVGGNKPFDSVLSVGKNLVQLTEDRKSNKMQSIMTDGPLMQTELRKGLAECNPTGNLAYTTPFTYNGVEVATDALKGYVWKDQDWTSSGTSNSPLQKFKIPAAGLIKTHLWLANGYVSTFHLTKTERCMFLQKTNKQHKDGSFYFVVRDDAEVRKWIGRDVPIRSWAEMSGVRNSDLRRGYEYEIKDMAFRPDQLDQLFGAFRGRIEGRRNPSRDPREFAISLDLSLHASSSPVFRSKAAVGFQFALDTYTGGSGFIWEFVSDPYPQATATANMLTHLKTARCALNTVWTDFIKVPTNPALSVNTYKFLDWVLKTQAMSGKFRALNWHAAPQITHGDQLPTSGTKPKEFMEKIRGEFDKTIADPGNDVKVGDANKAYVDDLMKISQEQYLAACTADPSLKPCNLELAGTPWAELVLHGERKAAIQPIQVVQDQENQDPQNPQF